MYATISHPAARFRAARRGELRRRVEDIERKIGELAHRGLSVPEIADWLQVPAAEVRALLDPEPNDDPDTNGEGSFPASDAPPLG